MSRIKLSDLCSSDLNNNVQYNATSVEDSTCTALTIGKYNFEKEFQFLKQAWCTDDKVENFWFLDDKGSILELNKYTFILRKKTGNIDNWNGDEYTEVYSVPRSTIINKDTIKYGVTNVNATKGNVQGKVQAYLWAIEIASTTSMTIKFYNFCDTPEVAASPFRVYTIDLVHRELGEQLIPSGANRSLNTYSGINVSDFIFEAAYTATSIYDRVIFGIHVDNNFNQWAIIFNLNEEDSFTVIQGYGYVGTDGSLTGGEIPYSQFDSTKGFSGTVYSLDALDTEDKDVSDISEIYTLPNMVVGTAEQQWYIFKSIDCIVSHLTYQSSTYSFKAVPLYINNNYDCTYKSGSFYTRTLTDDTEIVESVDSYIFGTGAMPTGSVTIIKTILSMLTNPYLYRLLPKMSTSGYLQQALGQYAYVHYNSNSISKEADLSNVNELDDIDTETFNIEDKELRDIKKKLGINKKDTSKPMAARSDELTFNKRFVRQHADYNGNERDWGMLADTMLMQSITGLGLGALTINSSQNQRTIAGVARNSGQMYMQNMNALESTNMMTQSNSPSLSSTVSSVLSLDMFYSTSDKQHVYAGPGYVNHNFVAQCVAQSLNSSQFELNQIVLKYCNKEATLYRPRLIIETLQLARDLLKTQAQVSSNAAVLGTSAPGAAAGLWMLLIQAVLDITIAMYSAGYTMLESICNSVGGNGAESNLTAKASRHNYNIEGKHKYGAKHASFMWPCVACNTPQVYVDEKVVAECTNNKWSIHQSKWYKKSPKVVLPHNLMQYEYIPHVTDKTDIAASVMWQSDDIAYYTANCKGKTTHHTLPLHMAYIVGTETFLSKSSFKNENIDCGEPVFTTPVIQDYIIDEDWQIYQTATAGATVWISCRDTKLIDGTPSNMIITPWFCGVASPYAAVEIKHGVDKQYVRPWAVSPEVLALNQTGKNAIYQHKLYHAFDGIGYRIVNWTGTPGMNKEFINYHYCFQTNDKFKRSNKLPPNQLIGNFNTAPTVAVTVDAEDKLYNEVTIPSKAVGLDTGVIGEDKDVLRYSLPIFTEFVSTLPATVKTLAPYKLAVVDGVTSLCTELRNTQSAYKAPESVDFTIGKSVYRMTPEYICSVTTQNGVVITEDLVPTLGLTFIGATPFEAFLYSQATRQYYVYTGGTNIQKVDMLERFRDIQKGRYDFVNQEVVMQCLATFDRLDAKVHDDEDETDNIMCLILKDSNIIGELPPPVTTIFNTESWFRILSLPCGVTYQGPNRCIINRFTYSDYMLEGIKRNKGNWTRVPREEYHPFRTYKKQFQNVQEQIGSAVSVKGWTHNPFLLVTSPLGIASETDCLFEWEITFAWTKEMEDIYADKEYACINIMGETMTPGGKVVSARPTHVYLTKDLFTRSGNFGYYSFRYQSKNGAGNRERLHIWADAYIAISGIQCEYKEITTKRNEILTIQADIHDMQEM